MKGIILIKNSSGKPCDDCIFKDIGDCCPPRILVDLIGDCADEGDTIYQVDYVEQVK